MTFRLQSVIIPRLMGGRREARDGKSLVSEGILFKSAEGELLLVRQTYGAHVRRRGMKARPPVGGFAFSALKNRSARA